MRIQRIVHHLSGLYRLIRRWPDLHRVKRKFFGCITVDMDAHGYPQAFERGIPFLLNLYDRIGLKGRVTWFANCDEDLFNQYALQLRRIRDLGYEIALHSHLETMQHPNDRSGVLSRLSSDKGRLENFLGQKVIGFRSGRFFRTPAIMKALPQLDFRYDSSYTYGRVFKVGGHTMDDSLISGRDSVFFLSGRLMEFPVWEPYPDPAKIVPSDKPYFITTLVHPYNMVSGGRNNLIIQRYYKHLLELLSRIPTIEFIPLSKALEIWTMNAPSGHS